MNGNIVILICVCEGAFILAITVKSEKSDFVSLLASCVFYQSQA